MVTKSQKPNLKAKLKKAQAKIKKLEDIQKQGLEALKQFPNIRHGVYGVTFAGLTWAYYSTDFNLFPSFFFQFGEGVKTPKEMRAAMFKQYLDNFGGAGEILEWLPEESEGSKAQRKHEGIAKELIRQYETITDETERKILQKKKQELDWEFYKYRSEQMIIAMGMAGATMLFLLETTPSEVANVAAKLLDAVTPGT